MASDVTGDWVIGQAPEGREPLISVQCACGEMVPVTCGVEAIACDACGRLHEAKIIRRTLPPKEATPDDV